MWLDEEADREIYVECLLRTMTTGGILLLTFTPLMGVTDIVRDFLEEQTSDSGKFVVQATWDDVPHLSAEAKAELLLSIPPYQREARSKGVPQLRQLAPSIRFRNLTLWWRISRFRTIGRRLLGLDVGWNKTAAIWGARDNESGIIYLTSEHYMGLQEPILHSQAIKGSRCLDSGCD